MEVKPTGGLLRYFDDVPDPRASNVTFSLTGLLTMTLLAVLCRCEDFDEIACWAEQRAGWLAGFLDLPRRGACWRTPHADTFERVFRRINPAALERAFIAFTQGLAEKSEGRLVAIDGKTLRGSIDHGGRKAAIHLVQAWDEQNHLVLGQLAVDDGSGEDPKSNEITAVPKLLELLDLKGAVVSLDAMHCQKDTAAAVRKAGGEYLLCVKQNHKTLHEDLTLFFEDAIPPEGGDPGADVGLLHAVDEPDNTHGRLDERQAWASADVGWLRRRHPGWKDLRGVVCVECKRLDFKTGKQATTRRCYLTSLDPRQAGADELLAMVRGHWGIENRLHWCLDVCFREDASRVRKDHGPRNLAVIRRQTLNLLRRNPPPPGKYASRSDKVSLKRRRLICSLDDDYLLQTLRAG